jgi:hypothetical protein
MHQTWGPDDLQILTSDDFNNLPDGPDIPDYPTHGHDFMLAMQDIYCAKCFSLQMPIGTLFHPLGLPYVYVLGEGCASWYVPNPTTLQVIENNYGVTIQDLSQSLLGFFRGRSRYSGLHDRQGRP